MATSQFCLPLDCQIISRVLTHVSVLDTPEFPGIPGILLPGILPQGPPFFRQVPQNAEHFAFANILTIFTHSSSRLMKSGPARTSASQISMISIKFQDFHAISRISIKNGPKMHQKVVRNVPKKGPKMEHFWSSEKCKNPFVFLVFPQENGPRRGPKKEPKMGPKWTKKGDPTKNLGFSCSRKSSKVFGENLSVQMSSVK